MQQFVVKILRDDFRNSYEFYNGVVLEQGERAYEASAQHTGCLFTVHCQLMHEGHGGVTGSSFRNGDGVPAAAPATAAPSTPSLKAADRGKGLLGVFDMDKDEPAFVPPSPEGSFSSPPARTTRESSTGRNGKEGRRDLPGTRGFRSPPDSSNNASAIEMRTFGEPSTSPTEGLETEAQVARTTLASGHLAGSTTTEDFILWASHAFLQEHLPLVLSRVGGATVATTPLSLGGAEDGVSRRLASEGPTSPSPFTRTEGGSVWSASGSGIGSAPAYGASISTTGPAVTSVPRPHDDKDPVVCVRTADILKAEVETHHVTARERRIHAVTLDVRDYSTLTNSHMDNDNAPAAFDSPATGRVVAHRFIFQNGGMTRFLSTLRILAPSLIHPSPTAQSRSASGASSTHLAGVDEPRAPTAATAGGRGPLEGSFGFRVDNTSSPSSGTGSPLQPPRAASVSESSNTKGWRARWPTSFFGGLRRTDHANKDKNLQEPSAATQVPFRRTGAGSVSSSSTRDEHARERRSTESSFSDLTELDGARSLIPLVQCSGDGSISSGHLGSRVRLGPLPGRPHSVAVSAPSLPSPQNCTPLTEDTWRACFEGPDQVMNYKRFERARESVYRCGIDSASAHIRFEVWMYLLGVFPLSSTRADRTVLLSENKTLYDILTTQWTSMLPEQIAHFRAFRDRQHAIEKDVSRTDRGMALYSADDSPHLKALQHILMAHVQYNFDAGYSQGMSDVASVAVVLVHHGPKAVADWISETLAAAAAAGDAREKDDDSITTDTDDEDLSDRPSDTARRNDSPSSRETLLRESAAFLCFRAIIGKHMAQNFSMDPLRGMSVLLRQVQILVRHFVPDVYAHLRTCMASDMTFCFRWLLMCFKREFPATGDAMRLWDTIFGCPYTPHYEVVIIVALLVHTGTQMMVNLHSCDAVLKFANNLAGNVRVEDLLRCAVDFYDGPFVSEVARLEGILQGAYVPPRRPTVEEVVKLCVMVDGDIAEP